MFIIICVGLLNEITEISDKLLRILHDVIFLISLGCSRGISFGYKLKIWLISQQIQVALESNKITLVIFSPKKIHRWNRTESQTKKHSGKLVQYETFQTL